MKQNKYEVILRLMKWMPKIKAYTLRLMLYLITVMNDEDWIQVTQAVIKENTGMGSRAVTLAIAEAEELGLIKRYPPRNSLFRVLI